MSIRTYSETQKEIVTEIKNVTVYQQGAQISREGNVLLQKGKTNLVFKGLPSKISPESIQVSATNDVMIVSVTNSLDFLNKSIVSKEITSLTTKQRVFLDSIKILTNIKSVYSQEKEMIIANKSIAGDNGVNINELEQAASFFRKRLTEIETNSHKIDNTIFDLKNEVVIISKQLLELNSKIDLPTSMVNVVVSSEIDTKTDLELSYFISDASWVPSYDIRIKDIREPLNLFYKAKVSQNTDESWDNVKLTLSTGNPSISNNKPELTAYILTFDNYYNTRPYIQNASNQIFKGNVKGIITDAETGETLPGVTILVKGTQTGAIADINGNYSLDVPQGYNTLVFSFIGYQSQEVQVNSPSINIKMNQDNLSLDEVVVIGYGVSSNTDYALQGRATGITTSSMKMKEQIPLAIEKRQLTTEFQIDIPYSIPSDNKPYDVTMVEYEISAGYKYTTVPKLSNDAFLIAEIPDWIKYNLLSGNANLFFKGVYQGETYIDLDTPSDTLTLSVGRDNDIIVSREIQKDYVNRSLSGITRKEQKAWTISLKNNKDIPINISVEDQYPISNTGDIKIELTESTGAKLDEATGKLTWDLILNPNEKKEIDLRYSVRYPTGRSLIVE